MTEFRLTKDSPLSDYEAALNAPGQGNCIVCDDFAWKKIHEIMESRAAQKNVLISVKDQ